MSEAEPVDLVRTTGDSLQPIEIGTVQWMKDYDQAIARAGKENKPVLVLFQEVPGCSGCKSFGAEVLSHSLIVEAIESEFVPLVVYNNKGGRDAELLNKFGEPAWNYQVLRFLDTEGTDVIPRKDRIWSVAGVATRMSLALKKTGHDVPAYLSGLATDFESPRIKQVLLAQHCFWTGERILGAMEGVVKTQAGFYEGREVTRVWYDSAQLPLTALLRESTKQQIADKAFLPEGSKKFQSNVPLGLYEKSAYRKAPASDQKRQLQGTPLAKISSNRHQSTKLNAFVRSDYERALTHLSPRQRKELKASMH